MEAAIALSGGGSVMLERQPGPPGAGHAGNALAHPPQEEGSMAESVPMVTPGPGGAGPAASRSGWQPKAPATPPTFEDGRLLDYRHPHELPALAACLVVLAIILVAAAWQSKWEILLGIVAVW